MSGDVDTVGVELDQYEPPTPALFGTTDPAEVVEKAAKVADALAAVIKAKNLYTNIQGRSHVRVEGWQLLGSMLGVTAVCVATEPVEGGFKATVEARTADGRVVGRADAVCMEDEKRWKNADDYARLSMAQTRATSKALKGPLGFVVSLAGYETTPAEEMPSVESDPNPQVEAKVTVSKKRAADLVAFAVKAGVDSKSLSLMLTSLGVEHGEITGTAAARAAVEQCSPGQAEDIFRFIRGRDS